MMAASVQCCVRMKDWAWRSSKKAHKAAAIGTNAQHWAKLTSAIWCLQRWLCCLSSSQCAPWQQWAPARIKHKFTLCKPWGSLLYMTMTFMALPPAIHRLWYMSSQRRFSIHFADHACSPWWLYWLSTGNTLWVRHNKLRSTVHSTIQATSML